jgi:hypothetical protein
MPHPMHESQNKGDRKWAICKYMKTKKWGVKGDWWLVTTTRSGQAGEEKRADGRQLRGGGRTGAASS